MERSSESRRKVYGRGVTLLTEFLHARTPDDIPEIVKQDAYSMLDNYTDYLLKQHYMASTIIGYVEGAKRFLRYKGVTVLNETFREEVELPNVGRSLDVAPSRDQIQWVFNRSNLQHRAIYAALACSLMRPSSLMKLKVHHIDFSSTPTRIFVPKEFAKEDNDWETFLTPEASDLLKETLGENISTADAYAFGVKDDRSKPSSAIGVAASFLKLAIQLPANIPGPRQALVSPANARKKQYKIHLYSLKKFGFSQAYGIVHDIARAWAGQTAYLATYMKYSEDERRNFYLKCMDSLTIFPKPKVDLAGIEQMQSLQDRVQMLEQLLISQGQFVELENPEEAAKQLPTYLAKGWKIVLKTAKGGVLLRPPDSSGLGPAG